MQLRRCFSPVPSLLCVLASVVMCCSPLSAAGPGREAVVSRVAIGQNDPLELDVRTSSQVTPQTQVISNPERLVIDIPSAVPGAGLHNLAVNHGQVKQVRVSLFSAAPSVTRIVVDLKQPQWYQVTPDSSGFRVRVGAEPESAATEAPAAPTVGWVSSQLRAVGRGDSGSAPIVRNPTPAAQPAMVNGVQVQFSNGLLSIHTAHATLSEVLFQIQKQTGAEISIPAGTEQEPVAADFGPGPPSQVLRQLLDGSGLNFVVVGSETDPNRLSSVILSPKTESAISPPLIFTPGPAPPVESLAPEPDTPLPVPDSAPPLPDNSPAVIDDVPQPQPPMAGPQAMPPPN